MTPSFSGSFRERKWTVAGFTVAAMSMNFRRNAPLGSVSWRTSRTRAARFFFLRPERLVGARRRVKKRGAARENNRGRDDPDPSSLKIFPGDFHHILL